MRRLTQYFSYGTPAAGPRLDDALFHLAEIGGVVIQLDWVTDMAGLPVLTDFPVAVLPVKIYADDTPNRGAPVAGLAGLVFTLWQNEILRKLPKTVADVLVAFRPIGSLARVGAAAAGVVRAPMQEYRKSQNVEYAAGHLMKEVPKLLKTVIVEAADATNYLAGIAKNSLAYMNDGMEASAHSNHRVSEQSAHPDDGGHGGPTGYAGGGGQSDLVRGVQVAVVRPMIGATDAIGDWSNSVKQLFHD